MRRQSDLCDIYGVRSQTRELEEASSADSVRHSDSYHRYFRGYTELRRKQADGKYVLERYYTQPWILCAGHTGRRKAGYVLLAAGGWALFVWALCLPATSNASWAVALPGLTAAVLLVLFSGALVSYCFRPRKMTIGIQTLTSGRLRWSALAACCAMALTAAGKCSCGVRGGTEAASLAGVVLAAMAMLAVFRLEQRAMYTTVPNDTVLPEGEAYEIW